MAFDVANCKLQLELQHVSSRSKEKYKGQVFPQHHQYHYFRVSQEHRRPCSGVAAEFQVEYMRGDVDFHRTEQGTLN